MKFETFLLLTIPLLDSSCQGFPYDYPGFRYEPWEQLASDTKSIAQDIGYKQKTWDNPGSADFESLSAYSLEADQQQGFQDLGFQVDQYECFVNHYNDYWWEEMVWEGVDKHYMALGWTQEAWDKGTSAPDTDDADWVELSVDEKAAAKSVCFNGELWDKVSLVDWTEAPSMAPSESGVPNSSISPSATPSVSPAPSSSSQPSNVYELYAETGGFPYDLPSLRYTLFQDLNQTTKNTAKSVGYTRQKWNNFTNTADIESKSYKVLSDTEKQAVQSLGFSSEGQWDCFANHYGDYLWSELVQGDIARFFEVLGWSEAAWKTEIDPPVTDSLSWKVLNEYERLAAKAICFFEGTWNGESIEEWGR